MKNRVYLRAFEPEDYKEIVKWRNDREIVERLGALLLHSTRKEMGGRYNLPKQ